ncbi:garvicin Q family class II bacteriocin [Streptococcus cuniculipharyngis]|uniref:Garvicin Q family class II bacteriocin n=1 Tax=Streptococcus cuniculipharyngis TaxID=1562651 RepID=A0A5C5SDA0_9STRE|nr:garvicin Q family class II bacteriocin [Streptococcus cuniculipharyngis]TWS98744.1 garvicin Q family class II bacteriocin [Streptococcus cuniculipharyngis]
MKTNHLTHFKTVTDEELVVKTGGTSWCPPIMYGANGYSCRDKKGQWHYIVTKGPLEATLGVMTNGWASSAAGGFGFVGKP